MGQLGSWGPCRTRFTGIRRLIVVVVDSPFPSLPRMSKALGRNAHETEYLLSIFEWQIIPKLSSLNNTHWRSHSFCGSEIKHGLAGSSASQALTRLQPRCQPRICGFPGSLIWGGICFWTQQQALFPEGMDRGPEILDGYWPEAAPSSWLHGSLQYGKLLHHSVWAQSAGKAEVTAFCYLIDILSLLPYSTDSNQITEFGWHCRGGNYTRGWNQEAGPLGPWRSRPPISSLCPRVFLVYQAPRGWKGLTGKTWLRLVTRAGLSSRWHFIWRLRNEEKLARYKVREEHDIFEKLN